jgi:nucleoside-diphosphate-sugar epimerase
MKAIVTGASGFVGKSLLPKLACAGFAVTAITSRAISNHLSNDAMWLQADLFDREQMKQIFDSVKPDLLIHLAWDTEPGKFWSSVVNFEWCRVTATILELFKNAGGKKVVMAGTCAEYDWSYGYLTEDVTPAVPKTIYGQCKNITRQYTQLFCAQNKIEYVWARIFFPYGPGENSKKLIPLVVSALEKREEVRCTHAQQYRDYLHIDDVASAFCHLANTADASGVFNIASGIPLKLESLVQACAQPFNYAPLLKFGAIDVAADDPMMLVGDIRKLKQLGWQPAVSLEDGLRTYIDLLRN